jgi:DNA-binding MarR family transcriptional regulator
MQGNNAMNLPPRDDHGRAATAPERHDIVDRHVAWARQLLPDLDQEVEGAVTRIHKLNRYLDKSFAETVARFGLGLGDYKLLWTLRVRGTGARMTPTELAESLLVSSGAMTNRLDRLETAGYVARTPDPRDRRGVLVELTPAGTDITDRAVRLQGATEARLLSALDDAEKEALNALLRKLMLAFEAEMGPPPRRRVDD